jgi:hypothetical protein
VIDPGLRLSAWRKLISRFVTLVVEVAALCLPALVNRSPILFTDTHGYYVGGRAAIERAISLFDRQAAVVSGTDTVSTLLGKARAVRSVFYALLTYLLANAASLWLLIIVHAVIAALTIHLVFDLLCPGQSRFRTTLFVVQLAVFTTLSWTVSFAMPDVFTPVLVLCLIVMMLFWDRFTIGRCVALFMAVAATVVMHITNLPIAIVMVVAGALLRINFLWMERRRYLAIAGAISLGVVAMLASSVIGFKQWTLAPQSPPFLLARSIADGPGKMYLRGHCPQVGLEMCRHLDRLDLSVNDFIWDPDIGVYSAVSPDAKGRLRAESTKEYIAAALEHPWLQSKMIVLRSLEQLMLFTLGEYTIPSSAAYTSTDMTLRPWHEPDPREIIFPDWQPVLAVPEYLVVLIGLLYGVYAWRERSLSREQKDFFILVIATALIQALIGGALSDPSPRFEARIIWLIPMAALLFAYHAPSPGGDIR